LTEIAELNKMLTDEEKNGQGRWTEQDWTKTDDLARVDIARLEWTLTDEFAGLDITGLDNDG